MHPSTPNLLRAAGTTIVFWVTIASFKVAGDAADISRSLARSIVRFDTSAPFNELTEQQKQLRGYLVFANRLSDQIDDLHSDLEKRNLVGAVASSPLLSLMGFVGAGLLCLSMWADWFVKRSAARESELPPKASTAAVPTPITSGTP